MIFCIIITKCKIFESVKILGETVKKHAAVPPRLAFTLAPLVVSTLVVVGARLF